MSLGGCAHGRPDGIAVPYHLGEHLPGLDFVLPPDQVITADLPGGGIWERLAAVESAVAGACDLDPPEVSYLAASAIRQLDVAGVASRV